MIWPVAGYEFDVFLSYPRSGNPYNWVRNHFLELLRSCLADELPYEPTMFIDEELDTGVDWPSRLQQALCRSKILVSIYSPQYFRSPWCLAEWHSMSEREKLLGLASPERPQGLIYPILYVDSENFPDYARTRGWRDLKQWNVPHLGYQQTSEFIDLHRQVASIAIDLARLLPQVPEWQPDWPTQRPDPPFRVPVPVPRF
jgi:hypothetical protein